MVAPFYGTGWAFPVIPTGNGQIALVSGEDDIHRAIGLILNTACGERVMNPEFGSQLNELVFATMNAGTMQLASYYSKQALARWETRITVTDVTVSINPENPASLLISLSYIIKANNTPGNLVYPFYLEGHSI